jgi:hypothetical protein
MTSWGKGKGPGLTNRALGPIYSVLVPSAVDGVSFFRAGYSLSFILSRVSDTYLGGLRQRRIAYQRDTMYVE